MHATCVAIAGRGLLITGPSGSGKSALALQLMALGADLVADDRVRLVRRGAIVTAEAPAAIRGLIEARGLGILGAAACGPVPVAAVLALDQVETARLPERRETEVLGLRFPLLRHPGTGHFAAALIQYLKGGRQDGA